MSRSSTSLGGPTGFRPQSPLVFFTSKFYGVTDGKDGGKLYWATPDGRYHVVHVFKGGTDGFAPEGGLLIVGKTLYGTTASGGGSGCGGSGCGTVYSLSSSGAYAVVYAFQGGNDGQLPVGALINVRGTLYGTTLFGGGSNSGTLFSVTPQGTEAVLYSFQPGTDGFYPSSLTSDGNMLYGVTQATDTGAECGSSGCGSVFSVSLQGAKTTLYNFQTEADGAAPNGLLLKVGDALFGTTFFGGTDGGGTVFRVSLTGTHKIIHSFTGADGDAPGAGLIDVHGTLYGTTEDGGTTKSGAPGNGSVFSVTPQGDFASLYAFGRAPDGGIPMSNLLDVGGTLYGTTQYGGVSAKDCRHYGCGTLFSVQP